VAKLRNRMLVRVEGSWEKLEEVFLQTTSKGVLLVTTTPSPEARVQEEEEGDEGGEEEVKPPISMPTPLASSRGEAGEEGGGESLNSMIHHPP